MHRQKWFFSGLLSLLVLTLLAACGGGAADNAGSEGANALGIVAPWVRPAVMTGMSDMAEGDMAEGDMAEGEMSSHGGGGNSAAYMTLRNTTDTPLALVGVQTDAASTVELHTTTMENNVMQMRPVEQIDIPANGEVALQPGGLHIMLLGLTRDLNEGDSVALTLMLDNGESIQLDVPVGQPEPAEE